MCCKYAYKGGASNKSIVSSLPNTTSFLPKMHHYTLILGAAKTYYKSLSQEESLERRGKATSRKKIRRQKERLLRVSNKDTCFNKFYMIQVEIE